MECHTNANAELVMEQPLKQINTLHDATVSSLGSKQASLCCINQVLGLRASGWSGKRRYTGTAFDRYV